jgi:WD40 repeat protein/tetratricopeptide (TPR) repeat protein
MASTDTPQHAKRVPHQHTPTVSLGAGALDPTATRPGSSSETEAEPEALPSIPGYEVLGELGRGGIGIVYKSRQVALNRIVAVKLIGGTASTATLIRFRQEAEAVAKLQHPNIIQIFEVGACPSGSFIALEYVDGGTLREKIAGVPQPPREAAQLVETLARAVHHAHEQRLIHRDLKPHNVLLTAGGVPKIADFGLARSLDVGSGVTITTDFVGTPAYAAPEQAAKQFGTVGPGTDVYSLGVILYELLVGRVPFDAGSIPEVLQQVIDSEPTSPRWLRPDIPRDLETICLKCLRKEPSKRYASAAELADDLHRYLAGEPITARRVGVSERTLRWAKRHPDVAALLAIVFTLLTVVALGATVAAFRIDDARRTANANAIAAERDSEAARKAVLEGKETLLQSLISEAKASRYSRRVGQRFGTLTAIRKATVLAHELNKPTETFDELRNLAIAALALPDLKPDSLWYRPPTDPDIVWGEPVPNHAYSRVAVPHQHGAVSIRRLGNGPDNCGEIVRIPGRGTEVTARWSQDDRFLAVRHWSDRRVQLWRVDADQPALAMDVRSVYGFQFTVDGRQIVMIEDALSTKGGPGEPHVARIYNLDTGKAAREVPLPRGTTEHIALHPHRMELAIGLPGSVAFVDLTTGERQPFVIPAPGHFDVVWHPHGELLAVIFAHHVEIWNVEHRRRESRLEHTGGGVEVRFNQSGDLIATIGWSGRLRLWNPYVGRELMVTNGLGWFGPGDRLAARFPELATAPAGPLTTVEAGREYRTFPVSAGKPGISELQACRLHPGGRLLAATCGQGFSLIDLATGSERVFVVGSGCRDVYFERDGSLLVASNSGIYRYPVTTEPGNPNGLRVGPVELVPVSGRGDVFARSADGTILAAPTLSRSGVVVWQRERPYEARRFDHHDCRHVTVSPDGKLVASGSWSGRGIRVWEVSTGKLVRTLLPDRGGTIPAFSPNGRWLINTHGGQCWRIEDWSEGPKAPADARGAGFSPDGRFAAWPYKGFIILTDLETGRELARLEDPHQDGMSIPSFSPDGTLLIGTTDDSFCVRVWDLRKIRAGLVELGLDWDAPAYQSGTSFDSGVQPLQVRIIGPASIPAEAAYTSIQRERALLALWLNPFDADARLALGDSLLSTQRARDAIGQFDIALALRPDQVGGYRMRGAARFALANWEGCLADADAVLARLPNEARARWHRGVCLSRLGRYAEAIPDLTAALEYYQQFGGTYLERAEAYRALGQLDRAAPDWKRAAELASTKATVAELNKLAWRLLTGPTSIRDPKRALELIKYATDQQPADARLLTTRALAHYRSGNLKEAMFDLRLTFMPDSEMLKAHRLFVMAMCVAKQHAQVARNYYQLAVSYAAEPSTKLSTFADDLPQLRAEAEGVLHAAGIATEPAPAPREK